MQSVVGSFTSPSLLPAAANRTTLCGSPHQQHRRPASAAQGRREVAAGSRRRSYEVQEAGGSRHFLFDAGCSVADTEKLLRSCPGLEAVPLELGLQRKWSFVTKVLGCEQQEALANPSLFAHSLSDVAPRHAFAALNLCPSAPIPPASIAAGAKYTSARAGASRLREGWPHWASLSLFSRSDTLFCRQLSALSASRPSATAPLRWSPEVADYRAFKNRFSKGGMQAARDGDASLLRYLLLFGWDSRECDASGTTALHWAAGGGHTEVCRLLIEEAGMDPSGSCRDGKSPLHWAARKGHLQTCQYLAGRSADIEARTTDGTTVLQWACIAQGAPGANLRVCQWLVSMGADPAVTNLHGCTTAHWAASFGTVEICRFLATRGVDFSRHNSMRHNPLNKAALNGRLDISDFIVSELGLTECVLEADESGRTPMHVAFYAGHSAVYELLAATALCIGAPRELLLQLGTDTAQAGAAAADRIMMSSGEGEVGVGGRALRPQHMRRPKPPAPVVVAEEEAAGEELRVGVMSR